MFTKLSEASSSKRRESERRLCTIVRAGALLLAVVISSAAQTRVGFTNASLQGSYAAQGEGDDRVSVSFGIATYNGNGKTTRNVTVNAPGEDGERRLLQLRGTGTYSINDDGTGTATYGTTVSDGQVREVTFDLVITGARTVFLSGRRKNLATEVFGVQREVGVTVSLVTNTQTRLP